MADAAVAFVLLLSLCVRTASAAGDSSCWSGGFTRDFCCDSKQGPRGNAACWDGAFTFERCCGGEGASDTPAQKAKLKQAWPSPALGAELQERHAADADGFAVSVIPASHFLGTAAFLALLVASSRLLPGLAPRGMTADGRRLDGGPSGLDPGDKAATRQRRLQYAAARPAQASLQGAGAGSGTAQRRPATSSGGRLSFG
eukprot:TRINITY_DN35226_c0_g1_i1.p1 TRINITY_DN35226_c0_g1~~TRINITY_DN35226_c0_g1_i1.p1  ORF type:complete len:211 (+),score=44.99 TRINITY_DN35226_c0_g1_i1:34-633(+)